MSEKGFDRVKEIISGYKRDERLLLHCLKDIQHEVGYLPKEALKMVASHLGLPLSKVYSVASFYRALSLEPSARDVVHVCTGTSCHCRGAKRVLEELKALQEKGKEITIKTVNCMGTCALAPVVVVGNRYFGPTNPGEVGKILEWSTQDGSEKQG
jgi:NADH-quinone oxidoreductase subunit E